MWFYCKFFFLISLGIITVVQCPHHVVSVFLFKFVVSKWGLARSRVVSCWSRDSTTILVMFIQLHYYIGFTLSCGWCKSVLDAFRENYYLHYFVLRFSTFVLQMKSLYSNLCSWFLSVVIAPHTQCTLTCCIRGTSKLVSYIVTCTIKQRTCVQLWHTNMVLFFFSHFV